MFTIWGRKLGFCDGISRREFLKVGTLGAGGLTLTDLVRLRAHGEPGNRPPAKSIIMVYLAGGPSHIDMYDLKPDAPAEYRGPFKPIQTNVPGVDICELMPLQAKIADKLTLVRNMRFHCDRHQPFELLTGNQEKFPDRNPTILANSPDIGTKVSYLRKVAGIQSPVPPYVALSGPRENYNTTGETDYMSSYPGYLGPAYDAFHKKDVKHTKRPETLIANNNPIGLQDLALNREISKERLHDRATLLHSLDGIRRDLDNPHGSLAAMDAFHAQALEMLASGKVRDAFDLSREPEKNRAKYGKWGQEYLLALRLVEAGVPLVTLNPGHSGITDSNGSWDHHGDVRRCLSIMVPELDQGLSALIADLHARGLYQDVAVVVWGEMGRTPKLNSNKGGRDHWSDAGFALLAGGGFRMGQVIGATDDRAVRPRGHAYYPNNVLATLYHFLGYPPDQTTIPDLRGRPVHLADGAAPIAELLG
jgi:Protein of unknown function (DUF1501)